MTATLPGMGVLGTLDPDNLPVWGIDPSTVRISVGIIDCDGKPRAHTLSLPKADGPRRFGLALEALAPWLARLVEDPTVDPRGVMVEQPFAQGRRVHPASQQMLGVVLAALGVTLHLDVPVDVIGPPSWKAKALGKGRGFAKPPEYLAWAQTELGYRGRLEDEAAALGIAVARALTPFPRRLRGSQD